MDGAAAHNVLLLTFGAVAARLAIPTAYRRRDVASPLNGRPPVLFS
jgi:hypothetical protein